jgi:hypothetical protein
MSRRNVGLLLVAVLLSFTLTHGVFRNFDRVGIQDWDQHLFFHGSALREIAEFGQYPLWNPWYCGGVPLLANPQSRVLTPFFLLHLLLGTFAAIRFEIFLHVLIGMIGFYKLARCRFGLSIPASMLASAVFSLNSMLPLSLTVDMTWFLPVMYVPWFLYFLLKPRESGFQSGIVGAAVFLALIFLAGGAYPFTILLLFSALYTVFSARGDNSLLDSGVRLGVVVALAVLLGAAKFFPSLEFQNLRPRNGMDESGYSIVGLYESLTDGSLQSVDATDHLVRTSSLWQGYSGGTDENGMYIGIIPLLLAVLGLVVWRGRRRALGLTLLVILWICLDSRIVPNLWYAIHYLPGFEAMRVAQRFRIGAIVIIALLAGKGLEQLMARNPYPVIVYLLVATIAFDLVWTNSASLRAAFTVDFVPREPSPEFVQVKSLPVKQDYIVEKDTAQVHLPWSIHYASMLRNIGIIACYESANVSRNAIPQSHPRYRGEAFILEDEIPGAASARIRTWTPNELRIETRSAEDSTLVVNQNYDPGWKTADGREVRNLDGRIAVATRRGADSVTLEYSPRSAWFGLLTSALATIGVFLHWWRMRGR